MQAGPLGDASGWRGMLLEIGRMSMSFELNDRAGSHLLVHCYAGVSRSTAAAALIMVQMHPGRPARVALDTVARMRPRAWPNLRMLEFGDALLGRNGEIVAATRAVYRRALEREPLMREEIINGGRGREVNAALDLATRSRG